MKESCTLIKNSELDKLKTELADNAKLRKEYVEKKTAKLRNDVSEKDKEIAELKAKIVEMETNPQVDPMRMEIFMEKLIYVRLAGDYREVFHSRDQVFNHRCLNFNLDESLAEQIRRIGYLWVQRDRKITEEEVKIKAEAMLRKLNWDFENHPRNNLLERIANMNPFQRMKYLREYKTSRKNKTSFNA